MFPLPIKQTKDSHLQFQWTVAEEENMATNTQSLDLIGNQSCLYGLNYLCFSIGNAAELMHWSLGKTMSWSKAYYWKPLTVAHKVYSRCSNCLNHNP